MTVTYLGQDYDVPASDAGGFINVFARTPDRATTIAALLEQGMVREVMESSTDPETGEVTWTGTGVAEMHPSGLPVEGDGVDISWIGSVVLTPAVLDGDGVEVTPAVIDTRDHINIRLSGYALEKESAVTPGERQVVETLVLWSQYGTDDPNQNAAEVGKLWTSVSLIEPDTIASRDNVWL